MTRYLSLRAGSLHERLAFLLNDAVLYGGASAVSKLLALFTVPVLTRVLSRSEFGAMDVLSIWSTLVLFTATMGQDSAVARFFYETDDDDERRQLITEALLVEVVLTIVVVSIFWLGGGWFLERVLSIGSYESAYRAMLLSIPGMIVLSFFRNLAKWTFARWKFIGLSFGASAVIIALTVFLVLRTDLGVIAVFYAQLAGNTIFAVIALITCRHWLRAPRRVAWLRQLLTFGAPYMVVAVIASALPALDRAFITHRLSLDAMGLYAVGFKLASLVMFPTLAFQTAWGPFSLAIYKEADAIDTYNRVLVLYTAGMSLIVIILIAAAEPLLYVVASPKYVASSAVVLPLALAFVVESMGWILGIGIDLSKRTHWNAMSYLIGVAAAACGIALLIKPLGILGVAIGVLAGRLIQTIAYARFGHRLYPLRFDWPLPALVISAATAMCILMRFSAGLSAIIVASRIVIVLIALLLTWRFVLAPAERSRLRSAVRQRAAFIRI